MKRMIQKPNKQGGPQETLYKAHGDDANKAYHALTADRQHATALLVDYYVKFHLTSL